MTIAARIAGIIAMIAVVSGFSYYLRTASNLWLIAAVPFAVLIGALITRLATPSLRKRGSSKKGFR